MSRIAILIVLFASSMVLGADFEERNEAPKISNNLLARRTAIFVGSRMNSHEALGAAFGPSHLNENHPRFPRVPHTIIDVSKWERNNKSALIQLIQETAKTHPIIIFAMHANPGLVEISGEMFLRVEDFKSLDFSKNHVAFTGCNVGNFDYVDTRIPERPIPFTGEKLLEVVMRDCNAISSIGFRNYASGGITFKVVSFEGWDGEGLEGLEGEDPGDYLEAVWEIVYSGGKLGDGNYPSYETMEVVDDAIRCPELLGKFAMYQQMGFDVPQSRDVLSNWRVFHRK